jgi:hypothetical protein
MVTDVAGLDFGWDVARGVAEALCAPTCAAAEDDEEEVAGAELACVEAAEQAESSSRAPEPTYMRNRLIQAARLRTVRWAVPLPGALPLRRTPDHLNRAGI